MERSQVSDGISLRVTLYVLVSTLTLISLVACSLAPTSQRQPPAVVLTVTSLNQDEHLEAERELVAPYIRDTGIQVRIVPILESATERLEQYRQFFRTHSPEPDVLKLDVIWPGLLSDDLVDLKPWLMTDAEAHAPNLIRNGTVNGRLVGMPVTLDIGLLYYRVDLLQEYGFSGPPHSWAELEGMARRIQAGERHKGHAAFWGYLWQGAEYEGLTCNALEWQAPAGGRILDDAGTITVNNPATLVALDRAASWVGSISPPAVVTYKEEDTRNMWDAGNAAFMRNWQYAYRFSKEEGSGLRDRVGMAPLPGGGIIGGGSLGVSRYSMHKNEAIAFVRYFTGYRQQLSRWKALLSFPTIPAVYRDPELKNGTQPLAAIRDVILRGMFARPSAIAARNYDVLSRAYFMAVHSVLTHEKSARQAMAELENELARLPGLRMPVAAHERHSE
jgi:trehalose/maltose transport system substrate-binding protein